MVDAPVREEARAAVRQLPRFGRVDSIDILRGLALLWVMVFHLWADVTLHLERVPLYVNLRESVLHGRPLSAATGLAEVVFSSGSLGVQMFMMLSGISLTMHAYRGGGGPVVTGQATRIRRIVTVYWAGILIAIASIVVIAFIQTKMDGGSFPANWPRVGPIAKQHVSWLHIGLALSILVWPFHTGAPNSLPLAGSLWFVELLLVYYLVFPFALRLEHRVGPWTFALLGLCLMIVARAALIPWSDHGLGWDNEIRLITTLAPFRAGEFALGISIGHLFALRRDDVRAWLASPVDTAGVALLGVALCATGVLITGKGDIPFIFSEAFVDVGIALAIIPIIFKVPGILESNPISRSLIFIGVVSFTALITDDIMRLVADLLRHEGIPSAAWWFFLVVVYVPVGTLLAYPLAALFGLLPAQRAQRPTPSPSESAEAQPAGRRSNRSTRRRAARARA